MKFVLFTLDNVEVSDLTELTDAECIALAEQDGHIFSSLEDFQSAFNAEIISTSIHQLRIVTADEIKPTKLQKGWIKQANKYLSFDEDGSDQAVLNAITKIRDHADQDATIDVALGGDENVFPCEDYEFRFTCKRFLVMIGYNSK